ncbi:hypothetical protein IRJ41_018835 [Triplophysa rosa]|uniref:Tyrosine specific protein phosphatases domain-containing protein n=1 Tax=Triplophysa rosa TaxID=992332 RepID=A0A9W7X166_TRIRA|nr:hypothetical protein IRJ41_018835 [Triplophysa rosa]
MDQYSHSLPTVVHCSAGVGMYIAIDRLILQIEKESMVDVYGNVRDMHMRRPFMVQSEVKNIPAPPFSSEGISCRPDSHNKQLYGSGYGTLRTAIVSFRQSHHPPSLKDASVHD